VEDVFFLKKVNDDVLNEAVEYYNKEMNKYEPIADPVYYTNAIKTNIRSTCCINISDYNLDDRCFGIKGQTMIK